jgi:hypothetical protein
MRSLRKMGEIAHGRPFRISGSRLGPALFGEGSMPMLLELISSSPPGNWTCAPGSRSMRAYYPKGLLWRPWAESGLGPDQLPKEPGFHAHPCIGEKSELEGRKEKENVASHLGHSLFEEAFFFCTVKNVGDVPGAGCIYVETVVDRDSGIAFAKVYPTKNPMNAVDILASRVVPFFERQGIAIKEIHTRKSSEYCGLLPVHSFETFLATSHIQHLPMDQSSQPCNQLCEQFYRFLLKEFFQPALRRKFQLSLDELQKDLDTFVEAYNAMQMKHKNEMKRGLLPTANFPVDL